MPDVRTQQARERAEYVRRTAEMCRVARVVIEEPIGGRPALMASDVLWALDRVAALETALRWYADASNYAWTLQDAARGRNPKVADDGGTRARAALAGVAEPPAEGGDRG